MVRLLLLALALGCSVPTGTRYTVRVVPTAQARAEANRLQVVIEAANGETSTSEFDLPGASFNGDWLLDLDSHGWNVQSLRASARKGSAEVARGTGTPLGTDIEIVLADVSGGADLAVPDLAMGFDLAGADLAGVDLTNVIPPSDLAQSNCTVVTKTAEADSRLNSLATDANSGDVELLYLGVAAGANLTGVFRFDISDLPSGAPIVSAKVSFAYPANGCNVSCTGNCANLDSNTMAYLYYLTSDWDEGTVSYNNRRAGQPWQSPGAAGSDRSASIANVTHFSTTATVFDLGAAAGFPTWRQNDRISFMYAAQSKTVVAARESGTDCPPGYAKPTLQITYCP